MAIILELESDYQPREVSKCCKITDEATNLDLKLGVGVRTPRDQLLMKRVCCSRGTFPLFNPEMLPQQELDHSTVELHGPILLSKQFWLARRHEVGWTPNMLKGIRKL